MTIARGRRTGAARIRSVAAVAAATIVGAGVSGCATTVVTGVAVGGQSTGMLTTIDDDGAGPAPAELVRDLVNRGGFPDGYVAEVLDENNAVLAAEDLSGVPRSARVNPVRCQAPAAPADPADFAMASGIDEQTRSVLGLQVERSEQTTEQIAETIRRCELVTVVESGVGTEVTRSAPRIGSTGGAETVTYTQQVTDETGQTVRSMAVALARRGDVTVTATAMDQQGRGADADAAAELLAAALTAAG